MVLTRKVGGDGYIHVSHSYYAPKKQIITRTWRESYPHLYEKKPEPKISYWEKFSENPIKTVCETMGSIRNTIHDYLPSNWMKDLENCVNQGLIRAC